MGNMWLRREMQPSHSVPETSLPFLNTDSKPLLACLITSCDTRIWAHMWHL